MISEFQDAILINRKRAEKGTQPTGEYSCVQYLKYGVNRDGYWTNDHFSKQVEEVLDILNWIHPDLQVILEVDHSSGHLKIEDDGLSINGMDLGYGCKQSKVR